MVTWEQLYDLVGIKEFIYFISSPVIQERLFGIKLVFIFFAIVFFCAVIYFYLNSSYLQYQFLQDTTEFFSWQPYGLREINKRWNRINKKLEGASESDFKLAIIEADDFLYQVLTDMEYQGDTFEDLLEAASKRITSSYDDIIFAHGVRNSIVYNSDYALDMDEARRILGVYESAIKNISAA